MENRLSAGHHEIDDFVLRGWLASSIDSYDPVVKSGSIIPAVSQAAVEGGFIDLVNPPMKPSPHFENYEVREQFGRYFTIGRSVSPAFDKYGPDAVRLDSMTGFSDLSRVNISLPILLGFTDEMYDALGEGLTILDRIRGIDYVLYGTGKGSKSPEYVLRFPVETIAALIFLEFTIGSRDKDIAKFVPMAYFYIQRGHKWKMGSDKSYNNLRETARHFYDFMDDRVPTTFTAFTFSDEAHMHHVQTSGRPGVAWSRDNSIRGSFEESLALPVASKNSRAMKSLMRVENLVNDRYELVDRINGSVLPDFSLKLVSEAYDHNRSIIGDSHPEFLAAVSQHTMKLKKEHLEYLPFLHDGALAVSQAIDFIEHNFTGRYAAQWVENGVVHAEQADEYHEKSIPPWDAQKVQQAPSEWVGMW